MTVRTLLTAAVLLSGATIAQAQTACVAPDGSNEAHIMAVKSVPIAFSPARAPLRSPGGSVELALEGMTVPEVNAEDLPPSVCSGDDGLSNTNQLVVAGRPRVRVGIGSGLAFEAGWIPPISVNGVKANLLGGSLGWTSTTSTFIVEVRAHGAYGSVKGAFTCTDTETQDPSSTCFGGSVSEDSFRPFILGGDVSLGGSFSDGRARPYVGAGYSRLSPEFEVHYTTAGGQLDDSIVESSLDRLVVFGGFTFDVSRSWSITGQFYAAPEDAASVSFSLRVVL